MKRKWMVVAVVAAVLAGDVPYFVRAWRNKQILYGPWPPR